MSQLFADIHVNHTCLSMTMYASVFLHIHIHGAYIYIYISIYMYTIDRQPTSAVGESSKAGLIWMIVAIFTIMLAMIGAGATIVCSLIYFKKWGHTSKMPLKPSATLGEQGTQTVL